MGNFPSVKSHVKFVTWETLHIWFFMREITFKFKFKFVYPRENKNKYVKFVTCLNLWLFTCDFACVTFHMRLPMCNFSHVTFHMWLLICDFSCVTFHMWLLMSDFSYVTFHKLFSGLIFIRIWFISCVKINPCNAQRVQDIVRKCKYNMYGDSLKTAMYAIYYNKLLCLNEDMKSFEYWMRSFRNLSTREWSRNIKLIYF